MVNYFEFIKNVISESIKHIHLEEHITEIKRKQVKKVKINTKPSNSVNKYVAQKVSSLTATHFHEKNRPHVGKFFNENVACKE